MSGRWWRVVLSVTLLAVVALTPPPAYAAVSVSRAEVTGSQLRMEGTATANRSITVDGVTMATSDRRGRFKISRTGYSPPADCTVDVNDGSAAATVATLSGCTVTAPPPVQAPQITPDVDALGPGFVGADFTTSSSTTTTLTFGPDTLGPVHFEVVAGQLPDGLQLLDQNDGSSPNKAVNASIVGTPTTVGTSSFTVRATDANGLLGSRSYSITVNPAQTLEIVPQAWPSLVTGEFANLWLDGKGGVMPYSWAVGAGALPTGMSLIQDNPEGPLVRISGTPSAAGTFSFTLRLTDAQATTATRSFTVTVAQADTSTGPAAPTLLSPANGASVTTPFPIDWTEEFDPTLSANGGYNWQVSATSAFTTTVLRDSTLPDVTEATVSGLPAGTYFWRVQAVDGQLRSSDFSTPHSFTITGAGASEPGTAVLRLPEYGDSFHPFESFELFWTAAEGAATYELLVSKDSTFPVGSIRFDNISGTSRGITIGDFCDGCEQGTYFSRVVAIDAQGNRGLPSNTISFTISFDAPLPPPPTVVSPVGGTGVTLPVTLDWTDVPNPQDLGYEIEVSTSSSFADTEAFLRTTASQVTVLSLTPGTKFWRVRSAQGNSGPNTAAVTDWSTPGSFTVPGGEVGVESVWLGAPPCQDPCPGTELLDSGQEIEVSLQLTGTAPAGGVSVALSTDKPAAAGTFPSSVTVPEGLAFTTFRLVAGQVTEPTLVTLTATVGQTADSTTYTVRPTTVERLSFCCDSTGGLPAGAHLAFTGKVPAGGAVVSLSSDSPLAEPPATVDAPAGSFSVPISIPTREVTVTTTVTISATWNGSTVTAPLKLYPQQPPTSVTLDKAETTGTQGASGVVRIAAGQDHEVLMKLSSSHPELAKVPAYALIGYLSTTGGFNIATQAPTSSTEVTVSATGAGVTVTTTLTVHPTGGPTVQPTVASVALNPTSVVTGESSTATVTLSGVAPSGGASVGLTSADTAVATVPTSVTVPAGATSATFAVTSRPVTTTNTTTITASYAATAASAVLTVNPSPAAADTVSVQRAEYDSSKRVLQVEASSTSSTATMRVFVTSTGTLIGTLANDGGGRYRGQLSWSTNPQNVTVTSSLGGTATRAVTLK
jgi:hypothetical protein